MPFAQSGLCAALGCTVALPATFIMIPVVRHRNGIRSRLGAQKPGGPVLHSIGRLYKKSKLTPAEVAKLSAASAEETPGVDPTVRRMAKSYPNKRMRRGKLVDDTRNTSRNIARAFRKSCGGGLPDVYDAPIIMWDRKSNSQCTVDVSFLLIHEVLDKTVKNGEESEWSSFDASQAKYNDDLNVWAASVGVDLAAAEHWISIAIWGDSAPYTHKDSVFLILWRALSGSVATRFWFCAFPKRDICRCGCMGRCTFNGVFLVLKWCFDILLVGLHPWFDHKGDAFKHGSMRWRQRGKPLRFRGCCLRKYGDWQWYKQVLSLQGWRGEGPLREICWMCRGALSGPCHCYDFGPGALWRSSRRDMTSFWAAVIFAGGHVSALYSVPGFVTAWIKVDWMHCSCLGILQYAQGHALAELYFALGGVVSNRLKSQQALSCIYNMMSTVAKAMNKEMPFNDLTLGMVIQEGKKIKLKAAEGRYTLPILCETMARCFETGSNHARLRLQCLEALRDAYQEMEQWVDGGVSARNLRNHGVRHLLLYGELVKDAGWLFYPKHHLFAHLCEETETNPRMEWNYSDESEIGSCATMAASANPLFLRRSLIRRYAATFDL